LHLVLLLLPSSEPLASKQQQKKQQLFVVATMVMGESYLKGILRPPIADPKALPPNPPHPFQKDVGFYLKQRFFKHHFPLVFGFGVAIWAFSKVDQMMRDGKKRAYDEAVAAGKQPWGHHH
jgi:hypothetical protein